MSNKIKHTEKCEQELGCSFPEVDAYLDQFFIEGGDDSHRQQLHHTEGVEEIRRVFSEQHGSEYGNRAARAAEIHIMEDFGIDHVPTRNEVLNRLLAFKQAN